MSKGPGHVQREIARIFEENPKKRLTVRELAEHIYPGEYIEHVHVKTVNRAIRSLASTLNLVSCRAGVMGSGGWHHVWGVK